MPDGTTINIIAGTISIADGAFASRDALTTVTIPNSVISIGDMAFAYCTALTTAIFATESNITTEWTDITFSSDDGMSPTGASLWTAYTDGSKAGTYTRDDTTWTQQP
jgi:hypothetical protein